MLAVGLLVALLLALPTLRRHVRAASLLTALTSGDALSVPERELRLEDGTRARRYGSADRGAPLVALIHGVHPDGIDEPRLVRFAQALASEGFVVVTPELEALASVRLDPNASTALASACDAIARLEGRSALGVIGISVGGGLALVAAPRTERIGAILAIGPHHQIAELAQTWLDDDESERYGAQVLAYAYADDYFEGIPDADAVRAALGALLREERPELASLSPEARARLDPLRHGHELAPAAPRLRQIVEAHAADLAALSPAGHLVDVKVPVFLLHGQGDPLVPSTESRAIQRERPEGTQLLRTPLLGHADHREVSLLDQLEVVRFMAGALAAFDAL